MGNDDTNRVKHPGLVLVKLDFNYITTCCHFNITFKTEYSKKNLKKCYFTAITYCYFIVTLIFYCFFLSYKIDLLPINVINTFF